MINFSTSRLYFKIVLQCIMSCTLRGGSEKDPHKVTNYPLLSFNPITTYSPTL
ncbi:hypothetical protein Hanom_Chr03g00242631 [Helianthus anomalus]